MVVGCTLRLCIGPKKSSDSAFDQSVDPKESHGFLIVKVLGPMRFMRERDYAVCFLGKLPQTKCKATFDTIFLYGFLSSFTW